MLGMHLLLTRIFNINIKPLSWHFKMGLFCYDPQFLFGLKLSKDMFYLKINK